MSDHILWCLSRLAQRISFREVKLVLHSLETHLSKCFPEEAASIDRGVYKIISDVAAIQRILWSLQLHRQLFDRPGDVEPKDFSDSSSENEFYGQNYSEEEQEDFAHNWNLEDLRKARPALSIFVKPSVLLAFRSVEESDVLILPLNKFRMPRGERNLQWLTRADACRNELSKVWDAIKAEYERILNPMRNIHDTSERTPI